jgi:cytochrome c oxidase assembly factor CtaG
VRTRPDRARPRALGPQGTPLRGLRWHGLRLQGLRPWLALVAIVLTASALLPPAATAADHWVFAQVLQFAVLAVVAPALLVLGAPWRLGRSGGPVQARVDRLAMARSHRTGTLHSWTRLLGFIAAVIFWRLPVAVNALARHPVLTVVQAVILITVGCGLWLELVESPPLLPRISRPQRAAFAALSMWSIWAMAYIMGFARGVWFAAYSHQPTRGLSTVADQQIAAGVLWAIPAVCFAPVVFVAMMTWLRDSSDPDAEFGAAPPPGGGPALMRPPRGWRTPSA